MRCSIRTWWAAHTRSCAHARGEAQAGDRRTAVWASKWLTQLNQGGRSPSATYWEAAVETVGCCGWWWTRGRIGRVVVVWCWWTGGGGSVVGSQDEEVPPVCVREELELGARYVSYFRSLTLGALEEWVVGPPVLAAVRSALAPTVVS
eukprot:5125504-Prymnesium_polylepis.1